MLSLNSLNVALLKSSISEEMISVKMLKKTELPRKASDY